MNTQLPPLRTLQLGNVLVDIFRDLAFRDDKGTLVAYAPDTDSANLRCSVISILKNGKEIAGAGESEVREKADQGGGAVEERHGKIVFYVVKPSSEDPKSTIHYWYVGMGGHYVIVTLFLDHAYVDDPRSKHVRESVDLLIRSLRRADPVGTDNGGAAPRRG